MANFFTLWTWCGQVQLFFLSLLGLMIMDLQYWNLHCIMDLIKLMWDKVVYVIKPCFMTFLQSLCIPQFNQFPSLMTIIFQNFNMIIKKKINNTMSIVIAFIANANYEIQIWIFKIYFKFYSNKTRKHKILKVQKIKEIIILLKPKDNLNLKIEYCGEKI